MKKYIKCTTYTLDDLANAIGTVWEDTELSKVIRSTNDYRRYFKETYGWDNISTEEFDNAWDRAAFGLPDDEEGIMIGSKYYTLDDAIDWLDTKLLEHGNTYFFPTKDKEILNKLISKFGNTYFWRE